VGGQPGPSEKEEQRNQTFCKFQEPEQKLKERQLPLFENGKHITKGNWCYGGKSPYGLAFRVILCMQIRPKESYFLPLSQT
jgi:hypothetical protein